MQITCVHCSGAVAIAAEHLERQAYCPHCGSELILPREVVAEDDEPAFSMRSLFDNSISGLASMIIHMLIIFVIAFIQFGGSGVAGDGEDVFIGQLPGVELGELNADLAAMEVSTDASASESFDDPLAETAPSTDFTNQASFNADFAISASATSGSAGEMSFSTGAAAGGGPGGSFEGLVDQLRRSGLDIVIVFDATGSMGGELDQVKSQIRRIGETLIAMIPKTRIGLVAYRDVGGGDFIAKGIPLTQDIQTLYTWLVPIEAQYGGDRPESVDQGILWAIKNNTFRPEAKKVILIFGDAPPHEVTQADCEKMAADFAIVQKGVVSTVTCREPTTLPEFDAIAQAGGGESFLARNEREIMAQLIVLVFGSQHQKKVLEAFKMMGR